MRRWIFAASALVVAFTLMSLAFDVAARRAYGVERPWVGVLARDLLPSSLSLAVMPVLLYLGSFAPWFASETSVYRYQVSGGGSGALGWVPAAWRSLWYYQSGILKFHEGLTNAAGNHHPWESKPWTWPMGLRPMLYAVETGPDRCGADECARVQMLIGTPAIWWAALPVLAWAVWSFAGRRDWRYGVVLVAYGAAFAPWFANIDRQMYFFYATLMAPFLFIALVWFVISLVFTTLAPGAVSRAVARVQLSSLKIFAIGAFSFVLIATAVVGGSITLPNYLSATIAFLGAVVVLLGFVFGRVVLQVSAGKLIQKHFLAGNNRSETLALLIGVLAWTLVLSLPYVWLIALFVIFAAGVGLVLTGKTSPKWQNP